MLEQNGSEDKKLDIKILYVEDETEVREKFGKFFEQYIAVQLLQIDGKKRRLSVVSDTLTVLKNYKKGLPSPSEDSDWLSVAYKIGCASALIGTGMALGYSAGQGWFGQAYDFCKLQLKK